jgi:hypothetical protein
MTYQNFNRLPIVDQAMPLVTYTVEQDVYGDEEEIAGWFIVEHSAIDNDTYVLPQWYATRQDAYNAMLEITA